MSNQNLFYQVLKDGNISEIGRDNLERLKNDIYFFHELTGARQAAYNNGIDGAKWIFENYGISLICFQMVAMQYMSNYYNEFCLKDNFHYLRFQEEKQAEYTKKFSKIKKIVK